MLFSLFGCGRQDEPGHRVSADEARRLMEETLFAKYGKDFAVGTLESRHSSGPFNDMPGWTATATDPDNGQTFDVEYSANDGVVRDNYPQCVYGVRYEEEAREILSGLDFLTVETLFGVYPLSSETWAGESGYPDYLKNSGVYIYGRLQMPQEGAVDRAEEIYEMLLKLNENNIYFSLSIYYGELYAVVTHEPGKDLPSLDSVTEKLSLEG